MEHVVSGRVLCDKDSMGVHGDDRFSFSEPAVGNSINVPYFVSNRIVYLLYTLDQKMAGFALKWAIIYNFFGIAAVISAIVIDWDSWVSLSLKCIALLYAIITLCRGIIKFIKEYYDLRDYIKELPPKIIKIKKVKQ